MFRRLLVVSVLLCLGLTRRVCAAETPARAAWMRDAGWGVMVHYLHDWIMRGQRDQMTPDNWNRLVDGFDVHALATQLKSIGAGYFLISIGQNSGYYLSPNAAYDGVTRSAPSKLSRRDLVADLAKALAPHGIKLLVYLPSGAPNGDAAAKTALQWQNGPHPNREFQRHWEAIIREWSQRWGDKVAGWWFDGCYWPNTMYRADQPPNFASFAAAARAGNPRSAVAFNPGVVNRTLSITPHEDYIAGEISKIELWDPRRNADGLVDGTQLHVLTYLGTTWGQGTPRFTPAQAIEFAKKVAAIGGVITWDTPIQKGGTFSPEFVEQLKAIGTGMKSAPR